MVDEVKTESAPPEKMLSQTEVNELVVAKKREAAEKATRETEARLQPEIDRLKASHTTADAPRQMGGMVIDSAKIKEEVAAELRAERDAELKAYDEQMRRVKAEEFVKTYEAKLDDGRTRYDDFDEVVGNVDPKEFVDVIMAANSVEGTADIMYELARNPAKLIQVANAVQRSEKQAQRMLNEIAQSVRVNRDALENKQTTQAPLPRSKPSTAGTSSSEFKTVSDFKKANWLKG